MIMTQPIHSLPSLLSVLYNFDARNIWNEELKFHAMHRAALDCICTILYLISNSFALKYVLFFFFIVVAVDTLYCINFKPEASVIHTSSPALS